jgi:hypothetical protein
MNAIIGFDGFRPGDSAVPNDQAQQVVFTDAESVAANLVLFSGESYWFDEEHHFVADDARFVVEWRDDGPHLVRP